ncbi:MAG: YkgJ family cysteine cluster protein [Planctomycetes bacterium]|nr:YkgJ family cysteine cluster protein [Phycisphaerae bacterium]NBB96129.1 YkgJ family cysteine cluster protein [Planctomycetota bacterium]
MTLPCDKCKGLCCKYFCFEIDEPDDFGEFDDIRWYICHEGVSVHIDEDGRWYIQIMNPCNMLGKDGRCTIYDDRPIICRNYGDECEYVGEDYNYQAEFTAPESIMDYARKTLGDEEFEKQLVKFRAKAEGMKKKDMRARLVARGVIKKDRKAAKRRKNKKK